jgi:hypothetical protein
MLAMMPMLSLSAVLLAVLPYASFRIVTQFLEEVF